ncbi:MAG: PadR family transcriptional regulator [Gemmatimonadetes bacterium]|nr:PadR family transcriptional regulator [Gemmatimonadota bacterium]
MTKQIGSLEQLLMFAVLRLGDEAHGLGLRRELERVTGRRVSPGAIYTTMERLERHGLIDSTIGDEERPQGGRPRRYYRLRPRGARALAESWDSLQGLARGVLPELNRLAGQR